MPRPLCLRIAARCDKQATRDDLRSPDGAQRNPGPVTQAGSVAPDFASLHPGYDRMSLLCRIALLSARAGGAALILVGLTVA